VLIPSFCPFPNETNPNLNIKNSNKWSGNRFGQLKFKERHRADESRRWERKRADSLATNEDRAKVGKRKENP